MPIAQSNDNIQGRIHRFSWRTWSAIVAAWTVYGVFFALQFYLNSAYYGRPIPFGRTLAVWLICAYIWASFTPVIIALARHFPFTGGKYLRPGIVHLSASVICSFFALTLYVFARQWLLGNASKPFSLFDSLQNILFAEFHTSLILYWSVVGLYHAFDYYRRYRERERRTAQLELEASQLETQLAQAQLDALKLQLQPHFLFNTLNSISVLMQEDATAANRMLLRLSELLRLRLKDERTHEVPLRQEMEFLRSYLEIEQTRFKHRLNVQMEIDTNALDACVPNFILQPLVENAIRHGVARSTTECTITILARRSNEDLELRVHDDGPGIGERGKEPPANGIGLSNTRARLDRMYGGAHSFCFSPVQSGGTEVIITIPFHSAHD